MKLRTGTYLDPGLCYQARITAGRRQNTQRRMTPLCIPRFFKKRVVLPRYYPESLVLQAFSFFDVSSPAETGLYRVVGPGENFNVSYSLLLTARSTTIIKWYFKNLPFYTQKHVLFLYLVRPLMAKRYGFCGCEEVSRRTGRKKVFRPLGYTY